MPPFVDRLLHDAIRACAEALFPVNDLGAPDWRDASLEQRTLSYLEELPLTQRRLLVVLFLAVELGAPFLVPTPGRFSSLPADRRTDLLRRWRRSRWIHTRLLAESAKSVLAMIYLSHPDTLRYLGVAKTVANPHDPVAIEHRPDALPGARP